MAPSTAPIISQRTAWYTVIVLTIVNMVAFLDRQIISLVIVPLQEDLGLTDVQLSLLQGFAFAIFYATAGLGVGWLVDRTMRRGILAVGVSIWTLSCVLCGFAGSFWTLFLARVGVGGGESAVAPTAASMISDLFPRDKLALALGVYAAGANLGLALSLAAGGLLITWLTALGPVTIPMLGLFQPWQMAFIIVGGAGIFAIPLVMTITEPTRHGQQEADPRFLAPLLALFAQRRRMLACHFAGFGSNHILGFAMLGWTPTFLVRQYDWSAGEIGLTLGLVFGTSGLFGAVAGGWIAQRLERATGRAMHFRVQAAASAAIVPCAALAFLGGSATLFLAMLWASFAFSSMSVPQATTSLQLVAPNNLRGRIVAVYTLWTSFVGAGLGPLVVALITEKLLGDRGALGLSLAIVVCAAAAASSLFMLAGMRAYERAWGEAKVAD